MRTALLRRCAKNKLTNSLTLVLTPWRVLNQPRAQRISHLHIQCGEYEHSLAILEQGMLTYCAQANWNGVYLGVYSGVQGAQLDIRDKLPDYHPMAN